MSIYRRDEVTPEWEPIPWGMKVLLADEQESGFHARALRPIIWTAVPFANFPTNGILGQDRDWFMEMDVSHYAEFEGEALILIDNTWFGFPDPPRWGLATRIHHNEWRPWGHFPDLPAAWKFPDGKNAPNP